MRTLALIPAFNEAGNLPQVVEELHVTCPDLEVLVVDDASTDGSGELLPRLDVLHLQLGQHLGLGGAVRAGLRYALMLGYDTVLRLDADGQHMPSYIERLLEPLVAGEADAVVGSRFRSAEKPAIGTVRRLIQWSLGASLSRISGRRVSDPTSGFWAFGPRALRLLADHYPRGYSEPELRLFLHRNGLTVVEVDVEMRSRQEGRSTLSLPRAGLAVARACLAMIIVPLRASVKGGKHG